MAKPANSRSLQKRRTDPRRSARRGSSRAPTEIDKGVGETIRKLRTERNLTLAELGSALGISHQQLQKYETGANRLSAGMLHAVATVFNVPIDALYDGVRQSGSERTKNPADELRRECAYFIDRTKSKTTLHQMAKVLKAIASA